MLSRGTELAKARTQALSGRVDLLQDGTTALKDRAADLLHAETRLLKRRATALLKLCQKKIVDDWGNIIVNTIFAAMMIGLASLFTLLYTGIMTLG
jgi:hypothetical protein